MLRNHLGRRAVWIAARFGVRRAGAIGEWGGAD
jgi:hypothetical protein